MNSLRLEFYSQLSEEYPDLPLSELSPTEEETFYARAKYWAKDWDAVTDYIGTHECDILADCVSDYDSEISLQMFKVNLERLEEDIEEERANRDASQCVIDGVDAAIEGNLASLRDMLQSHDSPVSFVLDEENWKGEKHPTTEEIEARVRFPNAARELVRAGYSRDRLEEVIENVFEQEGEKLMEKYGDIHEDDVTGFEVKTKLRKDGDTEHNVCFGTTDDGRRCNQITEGCFCSSHVHQDKAHSDVHTWEIKLANPPEISLDEWLEQEGDSP